MSSDAPPCRLLHPECGRVPELRSIRSQIFANVKRFPESVDFHAGLLARNRSRNRRDFGLPEAFMPKRKRAKLENSTVVERFSGRFGQEPPLDLADHGLRLAIIL